MSIEEESVKNWIVDEGIYRDKSVDDNADFHFIIEFPKDNTMDIVKPKGKDCIVIGCATQVSPEHAQLMASASPADRRDYILDLQMGLNQFLVDFELKINQDIIQQFIITDNIFEDGLTKNELMKSLKRVFKAKLHCIFLIEKIFGSVSVPSQSSNENSMFI